MTPPSGTDLSVAAPTYNETERLSRTLKRLQEHPEFKPLSYEILMRRVGWRPNLLPAIYFPSFGFSYQYKLTG